MNNKRFGASPNSANQRTAQSGFCDGMSPFQSGPAPLDRFPPAAEVDLVTSLRILVGALAATVTQGAVLKASAQENVDAISCQYGRSRCTARTNLTEACRTGAGRAWGRGRGSYGHRGSRGNLRLARGRRQYQLYWAREPRFFSERSLPGRNWGENRMNDLTVSTPSAPAPLDPRFAPESPGVSSPAIIPSPFAVAIVPLLLAVHYANSALDRLFYDTEQFWLRSVFAVCPYRRRSRGRRARPEGDSRRLRPWSGSS